MKTKVLIGHLAPDMDCLAALWMLRRWGGYAEATLFFVPAGTRHPDYPDAIHVDTGGGPFDHHHTSDHTISSAELVRQAVRPDDWALEELVLEVTADDHARYMPQGVLRARDLIEGLNLLHPHDPQRVLERMEGNFEAWYASALKRERQRQAFADRIEFDTRWGLGVAVEAPEGLSSRDAYGLGAVLFAYRDDRGWMGVAAQAQSTVDLSGVYTQLASVDSEADWYLHPNHRLLLCGTSKSPPRVPSSLSLDDLIDLLCE